MSGAPSPKEEKKVATESGNGEGESPQHINLRVVGSDHAEVQFKIKYHTPLKKLMDAYCSRQGKNPSSVRFLYDGVRVQPTNTPIELEMADGDSIDVMVEQLGGFSL